MGLIGNSNLRFIRAEEEDKVESFMIHIIMTEEIIKIGTDWMADIGQFNFVDKIGVGQGRKKMIEEEILEVMWEHSKVLKRG